MIKVHTLSGVTLMKRPLSKTLVPHTLSDHLDRPYKMNVQTPRPTYIALPMDEDDLFCPPAPYLSSCSNFHSPSPVSFSQHRFCFSNNDDLDCDTPVLRKVSSGRLPIGGNLLGLFIEEKGVLEAAVERIEYDPRYSSVFEEEDEGEHRLFLISGRYISGADPSSLCHRRPVVRLEQSFFFTTRAPATRIRIHVLGRIIKRRPVPASTNFFMA